MFQDYELLIFQWSKPRPLILWSLPIYALLSVWIQEYFLFFEGVFLHPMSASLAFNEVLSYFPIHLSPFLPWLFVSRQSVFPHMHPRTIITLLYSAPSSFLVIKKWYSRMQLKVEAHKHTFLALTHFSDHPASSPRRHPSVEYRLEILIVLFCL